MQITVTFKQMDSSESLKSYVQKKLDRFDKMLDNPAEVHIVLSVEKIRHIAELTLTCDKLNIHAREMSESMYSSIDALMDKVKSQIKRHKEKVKRHMSGDKTSLNDTMEFNEVDDQSGNGHAGGDIPPEIVIEPIDYKPMDIEDAVAELDTGKKAFFVFNNARTEQLNVIYKHNNGKLGLIQPRG